MDSEHKCAVLIVACLAAVISVISLCFYRNSVNGANVYLQESKAAIAAGLCQEQNVGVNSAVYPGYHWTDCKCK